MPTAKEQAQAERLAQNAENQRRQDEHGYTEATRRAASYDEDGVRLAEETRRVNAESVKRDQANQDTGDETLDDDELVSEAVDEQIEEYAKTGHVTKRINAGAVRAPEDSAYRPAAEQGVADFDDVGLSDDTQAEIDAVADDEDVEAAPTSDEVEKDDENK